MASQFLTIRDTQIDVLEAAIMLPRFESRLLADVRATMPAWAAKRADADILQLVRHGVAKLHAIGVHDAPTYAAAVYLMIHLGPDFDTDPAHPWAADLFARCRRGALTTDAARQAFIDAADRVRLAAHETA